MPSIYSINKGVDNPIEFQGLRGQYLLFAVLGVLGLFMATTILLVCKVSALIVFPGIGATGMAGLGRLTLYSKKYGLHGLRKKTAQARLPKFIRVESRNLFTHSLTSTDEKD